MITEIITRLDDILQYDKCLCKISSAQAMQSGGKQDSND